MNAKNTKAELLSALSKAEKKNKELSLCNSKLLADLNAANNTIDKKACIIDGNKQVIKKFRKENEMFKQENKALNSKFIVERKKYSSSLIDHALEISFYNPSNYWRRLYRALFNLKYKK